MVSRALATLDLVDHDDARPAFPAVYLEGHTVLSYGELAGSADESGRVLRHDSRALVLCAGDRDLATLLAYLAALRLGHADRLSGPLVAIQDGDGTRSPLFLVHPDNGHADAEPRRTVPAMAAAYAGTVRAVRPTGPYLAGGCGIGAAIACEMAARLDDVRLVAATGTGLLEPPDTGSESWLGEPPRQPGAWPARCASCSADQT
jgi:hypothetical protein